MLSVKQGGIKYPVLSLGMTRPGIEPRFPGSMAQLVFLEMNGPITADFSEKGATVNNASYC